MKREKTINGLRGQGMLDSHAIRSLPVDEIEVTLTPGQIVRAVEILLETGIWHLSTITCQQIDSSLVLQYHFWDNGGLTLRVFLEIIAGQNIQVDSICPLIPGAEFYEREIREMLGVTFRGLANSEPLLLPDDWQDGYPLRKEYSNPKEQQS